MYIYIYMYIDRAIYSQPPGSHGVSLRHFGYHDHIISQNVFPSYTRRVPFPQLVLGWRCARTHNMLYILLITTISSTKMIIFQHTYPSLAFPATRACLAAWGVLVCPQFPVPKTQPKSLGAAGRAAGRLLRP
jgi:hypothetical protein